ncbi:MAG: glycosyltransferase family 4 protein [Xanthomonadales bacterium]|nr:glycosyltransferase family 4 protein [Xanthomonadales bacterium]
MHITLTANTDWYLYNFRLDLARAAVAAGHTVSLVCPGGPYVERLRGEGYEVRTYTLPPHSFSLAGNRRSLADITRAYRDLEPDLVHLHTPICVLLGSLAATKLGTPYRVAALTGLGHVFTSDSLKARAARPVLRHLFRRELGRPGSAVIFQNESDRAELIGAGVVEAARTHLVRGSGVDLERFRPTGGAGGDGDVSAPINSSGDESTRTNDTVVMLFASRLLREKGVDELVEAFQAVRREHPDAELWIAGEPYRANPTSLDDQAVAALGEVPGVRLLGHVTDMPALLAQVDIVALPSWREGTPKILLEAAACGLPIVATDIPGCRGVVEEGASGYLVPVRDVRALAGALARLVADPAQRRAFGRRGRAIVEEGFSTEQVNRATLAVYAQLADG